MIAYIDSSVLLRVVLSQANAWPDWRKVDRAVTSTLTEVECLRTLDRRYRHGRLTEIELADRRMLTLQLLERMERVELTAIVLRKAADPFPTPLGTLDALHLATALLWTQSYETPLVFATHDLALATAARATGLLAVGAA